MEAEQYDRALELFTPLAEAGSGDASYQLAVIFDQGPGHAAGLHGGLRLVQASHSTEHPAPSGGGGPGSRD